MRPGSGLWRLTHDHTIGAQLEEATGRVADRVAHILTNAIGGTEEEPRVEALHVPLFPNDRVLLCSDGLTNAIDDATLGEVLGQAERAEDAVREARLGGLSVDLEALPLRTFDGRDWERSFVTYAARRDRGDDPDVG